MRITAYPPFTYSGRRDRVSTGPDHRAGELVREGTGNEAGRLAILRQHQQQVTAQLAALTACLELITFKVKIYEESLANGATDPSGLLHPAPPGSNTPSLSADSAEAHMPILVTAMFTFPLGPDAALLPRTAALTEAYHELLAANQQRLARWEPWAAQPPTLESTRSFLEASGRAWLDGTQLPVAIAVPAGDRWQLAGTAVLRISAYTQAAEAGYWIDAAFEGRGLMTRAMTALLDQAFGPLGLARVTLRTEAANQRSRAVATRLGFTEEGVHRQAVNFPGGRRDEIAYGLLAAEWLARPGGTFG